MVTPPPLPAHYARNSFFHSAATISIFAPLFAIGFNVLGRAALGPNESGIPVLIVSTVAALSLLTGIIAGIVALFGIPKYGRKGILVKALCGILIPIILTGLAIPAIVMARGKAGEFRTESNIQRDLKKIATQLNRTSPQKVDDETRLDGAEALPKRTLLYKYTLISVTQEEVALSLLEKHVRPEIVKAYRTVPEMQYLRDNAVNLIYRYVDKDGKLIGDLTVGPKDL